MEGKAMKFCRAGRVGSVQRLGLQSFTLSAFVLASVVSAQAAIPGQPDVADVQTLVGCQDDAAAHNEDGAKCIGVVSTQCAKANPSAASSRACSERELLVWKSMIEQDLAGLRKALTNPKLRDALNDVQRSFYAAKSNKCDFERNAHGDSPDAVATAFQCDVQQTARHELWLRSQLKSLTKK
jgi:uncharacterized protein YecT (DUF1311 family)